MNRLSTVAAAAAFAAALATAAWAHHSTAMYDAANPITVKGEVTNLNWTNPHVMLTVSGAPAGQAARNWLVEMSSPGVMTRSGWTKRSLKPGDKVTVDLAPLRNGAAGGTLRRATIDATGQVLTWNFRAGEKPGLE